MEFTFLRSGKVAFFREDAEVADWTQETMTLSCTFPYNARKNIERGMTVLFRDPATNAYKAYEVRNCTTYSEEGYQQFTAEDIAIAELSDCHIPDRIELTDVSAKTAFNRVLSGTDWKVGTDTSTGNSSGDIERGSVWENISTIRGNWNVNIVTRVTVDSTGITGRFIDILAPEGTFRGLLLSIDKNTSDPCVTYDDSELYTALYAYGASYTEGETAENQKTVETKISGVSWEKTSKHPAKPIGQNYIEWPERTKMYGRNGKPRFGYYQNAQIKSPQILLEKTWEALKRCAEPRISITGTVTDYKRLGYNDVPIRLYDMAIVDYGDIRLYKQVVCLTVNLIDASGNRPTVGDYIPNIIYINRDVEEYATGGSTGVGGRGGGGGSRSQKKQGEFETTIAQNERNIILEAVQVDENRKKLKAAGIEIDPITGVVVYAEDVKNGIGANFKVQADAITSEVNARKDDVKGLKSSITQTANRITAEVENRKSEDKKLSGRIDVSSRKIALVVKEENGKDVVNASSIVLGINSQSGSYVKIRADTIDLSGFVKADQLYTAIADLGDVTMQYVDVQHRIDAVEYMGTEAIIDSIWCDTFKLEQYNVSWKSKTIKNIGLGVEHNYVYKSGNTEYTSSGRLVIQSADDTIYYLGR